MKIWLHFSVCNLALAVLCVLLASFAAASPTRAMSTQFAYQFTAGKHILGFQNDGVYIAGATHALRVQFLGAHDVKPQAQTLTDTHQRAQALDQVTWHNLWDGVDVQYRAFDGGIAESVYTIQPGASVAQISWRYNVPAQMQDDGSLTLHFDTGHMRESAPIAWQEIAGQRIPIQVAFAMRDSAQIGFEVGEYVSAYPLTIDPGITWMNVYGTASDNQGEAIALDASGYVYIAGTSNTTWGTPVNPYSKFGNDVFVAEINPTTGALVWNTFLGGGGNDHGYAIFVATGGWVYVGGTSTASWGFPLNSKSAGDDGFIAKLDAFSGVLQWHTFLGGVGNDDVRSITVDASGTIYVSGASSASWGTPVLAHAGGWDTFIAKYNSTGTTILWSTFLGGAGDDLRPELVLDLARNAVYVTGYSAATWGAPLYAYTGGTDVFVARVNISTGTVVWHTFLGAATHDVSGGVEVDTSGNVYVFGMSTSTWGTPINAYQGNLDTFIIKLDSSGTRQWSTFIGSSVGADYGYGIQVDANNNVYICGTSYATWGAPVMSYTGLGDGFVAKLNSTGTVITWSTFLGGADVDQINDLAVDANGNVFGVGYSDATWGTPVNAWVPGRNILVAKLGVTGTLPWNTFLGGNGDDYATGIVVGYNGNLYITGYGYNSWGAPNRAYSGGIDAFVAQLTPNGTLVNHTFLGGAGDDVANDVAVTAIWNYVIVVGNSSAGWGTGTFGSGTDAYIAYLDSNLALQWNKFYGGAGNDFSTNVAVVSGGAIYLTGYSTNTWGTPVTPFAGGSADGFAVKVDFSGNVQWSTFLGGAGADYARGIAIDTTGNPCVVGYSNATWGAPTDAYASGNDIFAAKLSVTNGTLMWNTFLGGAGADYGYGIVAGTNTLFVVGTSFSTWGVPLRTFSGGTDAVVAKINPSNGALIWHTFLGGPGNDFAYRATVDAKGNLYVTGSSNVTWGNPVFKYGGTTDMLVAKLDANGTLQWHGFITAGGIATGLDVAVDAAGNVYVVGEDDAAGTLGLRQNDATLIKINSNDLSLPIILK